MRPLEVRGALVTWFRDHASVRLPERVLVWAKQLKIDPPAVKVRDQRLRWGSCDAAGTLRCNWRVVQAPMSLVDYVVVHELIHLRHAHHDAKFWAALGRVMPDYEDRRERLRELGPRLEW